MLTQKIKDFSDGFVAELGTFVDEQRKKANEKKITDKEFQAITSTTFHFLGQNSRQFCAEVETEKKENAN